MALVDPSCTCSGNEAKLIPAFFFLGLCSHLSLSGKIDTGQEYQDNHDTF
jgi:hypothetical protein